MHRQIAGDGPLMHGVVTSGPDQVVKLGEGCVPFAVLLGDIYCEGGTLCLRSNVLLVLTHVPFPTSKQVAETLECVQDLVKRFGISEGDQSGISELIPEMKGLRRIQSVFEVHAVSIVYEACTVWPEA